jgi:5'-methylthioadenosine phosphorylase
LEKAKFAIIGGSGFENLFKETEQLHIETPYGAASVTVGAVENRVVAFLSRHGATHSTPPHRINHRANIWALHQLGVERIVALNAVGAVNRGFKPCDIVVPHDFIEFTKTRPATFYDEAPVTHVDLSEPYCPETRKVLLETLKKSRLRVWEKAVFLCTEGPRYETPAEVEMFRRLGCDILGMTGTSEAVLARELEMCYAAVCYVSNMAAGLQKKLSPSETLETSKLIAPRLEQALIEAVKALPVARKDCPCLNALNDARFP